MTVHAAASRTALRLGGSTVATVPVGALAPGAKPLSAPASRPRARAPPPRNELSAVADAANEVIEQNETDNTYTRPTALVVKPVQSADSGHRRRDHDPSAQPAAAAASPSPSHGAR